VVLRVRDLVKHFHVGDGEPVRAVDGVTLDVASGELVALYGPSGSGKSTLLNLIAGFEVPDRGQVLVDGLDIGKLSEKQHAQVLLNVVGIVGEPDDLLPGGTVVENAALKLLRFGPRNAMARIEPLLIELGLGDRLTQQTRKLSMGERQRVLLALALSTDPKLVLADEPTAHLDSIRSREIMVLLRQHCHARERAVLLATHDPHAAAYADRGYELHDGQLHDYNAEEPSPSALNTEPAG
jgi:putative ABC transport system ATP-binding protein